MNSDRKCIILGLDGAAWEAIDVMEKQGVVSHLPALRTKGSSGNLYSTVPATTPVAWTTFATGTNPGKHGVFDFFSKQDDGTYDYVDSSKIKRPAFWNILSHYEKRTAVVNFPISYPVESVNGFMISGFLTPSDKKDISYPDNLIDLIEKEKGAYTIKGDIGALSGYKDQHIDRYIQNVMNVTESRERALDYFLEPEDIDCLFVLFMMLDKIHHAFYKYIIKPEMNKRAFSRICECYAKIDSIAGKVFSYAEAHPEYTVLVLSDHGFCPYTHTFSINRFLKNNNLASAGIGSVILAKIREFVKRRLNRKHLKPRLEIKSLMDPDSACMMPPNTLDKLRVNRSLYSEDNDLRSLRDTICSLIQDEEKRLHIHLVEHIHIRDELYSGPFTGSTEEFILEPSKGIKVVQGMSVKHPNTIVLPVGDPQGIHDKKGIWGVFHSGSKAAVNKDLDMTDMLPLILGIMGVPVSSDLDGNAGIAYEMGFTAEEVKTVENYKDIERSAGSAEFSADEKKDIEKHLEDLGYI